MLCNNNLWLALTKCKDSLTLDKEDNNITNKEDLCHNNNSKTTNKQDNNKFLNKLIDNKLNKLPLDLLLKLTLLLNLLNNKKFL